MSVDLGGSDSDSEISLGDNGGAAGQSKLPGNSQATLNGFRVRPKLDSERLFDQVKGLGRLLQLSEELELDSSVVGSDEQAFEKIMETYAKWASDLFPYGMSLADFARTAETELKLESNKRRIWKYRLDYLRHTGAVQTAADIRLAEANEQKRLQVLKKREELLKAKELMKSKAEGSDKVLAGSDDVLAWEQEQAQEPSSTHQRNSSTIDFDEPEDDQIILDEEMMDGAQDDDPFDLE